jgi:hypothetical protein
VHRVPIGAFVGCVAPVHGGNRGTGRLRQRRHGGRLRWWQQLTARRRGVHTCDSHRVGATYSGHDGWLTLCVTPDRSRLRIKNRSGNSFVVWITDVNTSLRMASEPSTNTSAGFLAIQAVPPGDPDGNGNWALPPDSTIVASNDIGPTAVSFQLSASDTGAYNAAHSAGAYIDRLRISRSGALVNEGLACAHSAGNAATEQRRLDLALDAVEVRSTCKGFLDDALQRDGQPGEETESAWHAFQSNAKRLAGGNWDDELAYGIAKLAHR